MGTAHEINEKHVNQLKLLADGNNAQAQFELGMLIKRQGIVRESQKLLKTSALSGYIPACEAIFNDADKKNIKLCRSVLDQLHRLGKSGNTDCYLIWAIEISEDAARQEDGEARYPDLSSDAAIRKEMLEVLQSASKRGNADAALHLCSIKKDGYPIKLLKLAAKQGNPNANNLLAYLLMVGRHLERDFNKAHRAFKHLNKLTGGEMVTGGRIPEGILSRGRSYYLWAYACIEAGKKYPPELKNGLINARENDEFDADNWVCLLIDALETYRSSGNSNQFKEVILQADTDWGDFEGPEDEDGNLITDFFQAGRLNIGHSLFIVNFLRVVEGDSISFPRTLDALRRIAAKGIPEVQYILGLLGDDAEDWLGRASDDGFSLASYHLGFCRYANEPEAALRHLKRVAFQADENINDFPSRFEVSVRIYNDKKEIISEEFFHEIRDKALTRIREIETQLAEEKTRRQTERDMLSYLTHTLNNLMVSGPETARQAMRLLSSERSQDGKAINNIAAMFSIFLFAQKLLTTFKLYIADPDNLRRNWAADTGGSSSVSIVMALALRQTLSQIVFASNYQTKLQRLLPHKEAKAVKEVRRAFIEEMIPLDIDATNAEQVMQWVTKHMPALKVDIDSSAECHFNGNSTRFTFFFAGISELIYNALKYSDGSAPIEFTWCKEGNDYVFRSANVWSDESLSRAEGTKKGLVFLARLVEMLGASLVQECAGNQFKIEIRLPATLIEGKK